MLTDISSEMVTAVLPIYFVLVLGLTPLQFGLIDGLSHGAAAMTRLASGLFADRWQRNREVATVGYGLSAVCKLLLLYAGNAWGLLSCSIVLDRIGKGIRTAPRDALISLSSTPQRLGLAFGVHRAFDTAGALLGPLVAFAILAMLPQAFDLIFVTSFFIAAVGVAALVCFVKNVLHNGNATMARKSWLVGARGLFVQQPFRTILLVGSALGLVTVADSFFYLMLQRKMSTQAASFPLFYVATALTYLILAIPAGRLSDRVGRFAVFLLGHALLLLACISLLLSGTGLSAGLVSLALLGAYYACTDGVLMASSSRFLPIHLRATGLAIIATATGIARLVASLIFGAIWHWHSFEFAIVLFAAALAAATVFAAISLLRLEKII